MTLDCAALNGALVVPRALLLRCYHPLKNSVVNASTPELMPVLTAAQLVLDCAQPLGPEWVPLAAARDRILARDLLSPQDFPAANTSSMDGYAVRHADIATIPCQLAVSATLPAGTVTTEPLQPGRAVRIFTGSQLPPGADTVVMQEDTERLDECSVRILEPYSLGKFVRSAGQFCRVGDVLVRKGQRLAAPEVALLAAVRQLNVRVYRRPRVTLFSTGDELVRADQKPGPGQIVDSNQPGLEALVQAAGGLPQCLGIVRDTTAGQISGGKAKLKRTIAQALTCTDLILSSGGVSVGDYDLVEEVLAELGATIHIRKVAIKPGKPFTFATFESAFPPGPQVLYCGLPGNPVSAMVCFWRFVKPLLRKLQGELPPWSPSFPRAIATAELRAGGKRETYLWGNVRVEDGQLRFAPANEHGSGNLVNLAGTNALAILAIGQTCIAAGEPVPVLLSQPI
ncbi:gephyrin-like molybdotransferase Glp [Synechococcus sp. PCC 7336]|uniref:molybdopterin molybdotransferase MoeA n=1 Tax=Synechococcus sp. PCC 7336 TaxID=195250 RepID=UPI0003452025|nr:gephyrin-like molybdotransferase Glp [Synechococcus sp. PCC 7336]